MGMKNLWVLNVDEVLVADQIKQQFKKNQYEVFFPLNSQMKDVDLLLLNLKNNKSLSIQVKGSRTYQPRESEVKRYGDGSGAWFVIDKNSIFKTTNKIDFFVFVLHNFIDGKVKKEIKIDYLVIPIQDFMKVCQKKSVRNNGAYHFFIWIDEKNKRSFEFNNANHREIPLSKYLNNWHLLAK